MRTVRLVPLALSSCGSNCGGTTYRVVQATAFTASEDGVYVRLEKRQVDDCGWSGIDTRVETPREFRVGAAGLESAARWPSPAGRRERSRAHVLTGAFGADPRPARTPERDTPRRRSTRVSTALALILMLPTLAFAERPRLMTHDDSKGRARVEGCRPACSKWVQFPRSRPRSIVEAMLSASGQHFLVWSRAEGQARELDFFQVPGKADGTARRLGHLVPGFGGELTWLQGERVLHVWGCGTGCQGVRVYALDGAKLFDGEASLHEVSANGSVATATYGGIVRVFDAASGRSFVSLGDSRLDVPVELHVGAKDLEVRFLAEGDESRRFVVTCRFEREMTCAVAAARP